MRKAINDYGFIVIDNKFIGISLGYDYCAEHEIGIRGIKSKCAIPESNKKNMGVKSRTITKCPEFLIFKEETIKKTKYALLYIPYFSSSEEDAKNNIPRCFNEYAEDLRWNKKWNDEHPNKECKDNLITAWDEDSFGIAVMGENEIEYLKELYEAFQKKNITIAVVKLHNNPFTGSSLSILITDKIPNETLDSMYFDDKEYFDREDYEKKIGMKKIIAKYGNKNGYNGLHYFMACSPKWIDYNNNDGKLIERKEKLKTKYDIQYWINYSDSDNNYGWYSVEKIRTWLKGNKKLTEIK